MVLLAVLPILGIAPAFGRPNRAERNLGASYSWVGSALSPWLGFQCGWVGLVNVAGSTLYLAYGSQVCGSMVLTFARECHWTSVLGLDLDHHALIPTEKLTLAQALTAYTAGSARVNHTDHTGQITLGRLADLTILDRNSFTTPEHDTHHTRVTATYIAGQQVFHA